VNAIEVVRRLVNLHRAQLFGVIDVRGVGKLKPVYAEAREELGRKLRRLQVAGKGQTFGAVHLRAVLNQVTTSLKDFEKPLADHMETTGKLAAAVGPRQVSQMIGDVQEHLGRMTPVIQASQVAVVRGVYPKIAPTLLEKYRRSARLYGPQALKAIKGGLAQSLVQGETVDEAVDRLVGSDGLFEAQRWRAERIVRTELSYTANASRQQAMLDFRQQAMPQLLKRWVETFDDRTGEDSKQLNGQTVPVDKPFEWVVKDAHGVATGEVKYFMHGPNRPHDRSVQIPWQSGWGASAVAAPGPVTPTTRGLSAA
jgi:hypothetical protein